MACDRFVYWTKSLVSAAEVEDVTRDFFQGLASIHLEACPDARRWTLTLPKRETPSLRREDRERWIEVLMMDPDDEHPLGCANVITRAQDRLVNCLANQLAVEFCQRIGGTEDESE